MGRNDPKLISPKRPPYQNSTVDADKTRGQITRMLKEFGALDVGWVEKNMEVKLAFTMEAEIQNQKAILTVQIMPPLFAKERRNWDKNVGKYVKSYEPNMSQSMRLLYHYLKAKLNAVAYGIRPFEEEFLAEINIRTNEGPMRFADWVKEKNSALLLEGPKAEAEV